MHRQAKALLLAAGLGTRLHPLTDRLPKCLVPIAGRPLLEYWVDRFDEAGVVDVLINTHHLSEAVRKHLATINQSTRCRLTETFEPELLGSAGTITANRAWADGACEVVIVYADNLSNVNLNGLIQFHRSHDDPVTMMLFRAPVPSACGIAALDGDDRVVSFVEKPQHPASSLANGGLYVVDRDLYREIADMNAFDIGSDVLPRLVGRMRGWLWEGYHLDIGTHQALARAEADAPHVFSGQEPAC